LLTQAPTHPRLLIVISDGRDTRSAACSGDDAIAALTRERIPVAVLALAPEKDGAPLKRLARESGGVYVPPAQINTAADRVAKLRRRLALRYRVEFEAHGPGDALLHVRSNGIERTLRLRVDMSARAPEITAVRVTQGTNELTPALLPGSEDASEITLTPQFSITLPLDLLDPESPTPLRLVAYSEHGASAGYMLQLARRGSAASLRLAPDQRVPSKPLPFNSAAMALGGTAMALLLGAGAWVSQRNRAAVLAAPRLRPGAPAMRVNTAEADLPKTVARGALPLMAGRTRIHSPAAARLRISAPGQPDREVPVPGDAPLCIGRALSGGHDVCVRSEFVSGVHARFEWRDGALHVTDEGSSNGTRHNDRLIPPGQPIRLSQGDQVMCADVLVQVVAAVAPPSS
jgi:hypothetical protein